MVARGQLRFRGAVLRRGCHLRSVAWRGVAWPAGRPGRRAGGGAATGTGGGRRAVPPPPPAVCLSGGQVVVQVAVGQVQLPLAWMVAPQVLPLPLGWAVSVCASG